MKFSVGDNIIYHKPKRSFCPGPRARQVYPLEHGEDYHYVVDKFWKVHKVNDDGTLDVVTRTGKKTSFRRVIQISAKFICSSIFFTASVFPI